MDKIKILITEPVSDLGGVSNFILRIIQHIPKEYYEIHFASGGKGELKQKLNQIGIETFEIPLDYNSPIGFLRAVFLQRALIKKGKYNIVFTNTLKAGFTAPFSNFLLKTKIIYFGQSWRFIQKKNFFIKIILYVFDWITCMSADFVAVLSEIDRKIGKNYGLLRENKEGVISFSLDVNKFEHVNYADVLKVRNSLLCSSDTILIGTLARVVYQKDPETFVQAAKIISEKIPQARFVWGGDGDLKDQTLALAEKCGISDRFIITGQKSASEIPAYLGAIDIILFSSRFEGLPISILESMASKKAIIAAAVNSIPQVIIHNKSGFLFTAGDADTAAKLCIEACIDLEKRNLLAQNAYEIVVKEYSPVTKAADTCVAIFQKVLAFDSKGI